MCKFVCIRAREKNSIDLEERADATTIESMVYDLRE